jgi:uncharacterized membrane protein (DUF4010 family)
VIAAIIEPVVLATLAPAALAGASAFLLVGLGLLGVSRQEARPEAARNPFDLAQLLIFAAIYAIVATASAAFASLYGSSGLIMTTAVSAVFDVDAASLAALRLVGESFAPTELVGKAILGALAANALGRLLLAAFAGPWRFVAPLALATALALLAGGAVHWLVFVRNLPLS